MPKVPSSGHGCHLDLLGGYPCHLLASMTNDGTEHDKMRAQHGEMRSEHAQMTSARAVALTAFSRNEFITAFRLKLKGN